VHTALSNSFSHLSISLYTCPQFVQVLLEA